MVPSLLQWFSPVVVCSDRLSIPGIGIRETMPPGIIDRPLGTGNCLWMLFHEPVLLRHVDDATWTAPHTLMCWDAEDGHYYGNPGGSWRHSWIHLDGPFVTEARRRNRLPAGPLALPDPAVFERPLLDLFAEVTSYAEPDGVIVESLLTILLREVRRAVAGDGVGRIPQPFLELRTYLGASFHQPHRLAELAARVNLSVPHFCARFKEYFGMSAMSYLADLRLRHAAHLLRNQNLSITEIARQVGYPDLFQFSKQFKRYYGMCPRKMRDGV